MVMDPTFDPGVNTVQPPPASRPLHQNVYKDLEKYPWSEDSTFLAGLASILSSQPPATDRAQLELLALQVRCFYYNRQNNESIDPAAYETWRGEQNPRSLSQLLAGYVTQPSSPMSNGNLAPSSRSDDNVVGGVDVDEHAAPLSGIAPTIETQASSTEEVSHAASFADIVALIQSGQPIPGIRDIPDTVLTGQGSDSTQAPRRKPWERSVASSTSAE